MAISIIRGLLWGVVNSFVGRLVLGVLAFMAAWKINNYYAEKKGAQKVIEKSVKKGKEINRVNAKVRKSAKRPGAAGRVLRDYCRDCD